MITKAEWKRRQKIKRLTRIGAVILLGIIILLTLIFGIKSLFSGDEENVSNEDIVPDIESIVEKPDITEDFLSISEYARSGTKLEEVKGIIIHNAPDARTTAKENRDYYEALKEGTQDRESVHFIIGMNGEIIQCIPLDEVSYSAKERNTDTISIECCYPEADGRFSEAAYTSLVRLVQWLCNEYELEQEAILRHYDATGISCPKYYVENKTEWEEFLSKVLNQ